MKSRNRMLLIRRSRRRPRRLPGVCSDLGKSRRAPPAAAAARSPSRRRARSGRSVGVRREPLVSERQRPRPKPQQERAVQITPWIPPKAATPRAEPTTPPRRWKAATQRAGRITPARRWRAVIPRAERTTRAPIWDSLLRNPRRKPSLKRRRRRSTIISSVCKTEIVVARAADSASSLNRLFGRGSTGTGQWPRIGALLMC